MGQNRSNDCLMTKKKWQKTPTVVLLTILNYWPTVLRRMIEPRKGGLTFESVDENPVV